jgi:hypothetical protein
VWFAAHVILYFKFKDGKQDCYPVWENVLLVEAPSADEAFEKAAHIGKGEESKDESGLTYGGRPAMLTYAGIRKLVRVDGGMASLEDRPVDGAEVTYSTLLVKDARAFARLVEGKAVTVRYEE